MAAEPREPPPLAQPETAITAAARATPHGDIWVALATYPDLYRHGRAHVGAARTWDPVDLARLAREPAAAAIAPDRWVYLDVETTGLGAHAGTYAFLIGIAWFAPEVLCVEQILLRDPSEEPALLHVVHERLAAFAGIVTFNGKSFDLPLLASRAILGHRPAPHAGLAHCDLLHAARRAWAPGRESCRLAALEARLLGLRRQGDLESRFVPQAYLDYLRSGQGRDLDPILAHNRTDLVSLALLTAEAARFLGRTRAGAETWQRRDAAGVARDRLAAARVYGQAGDTATARALLELCVAAPAAPAVRQAARGLLAGILKRAGEWEPACRLWEAMLEEDPGLVEPVEELAKIQEHRRHDPARALAWVDRRLGGPALDALAQAQLLHRRMRLSRRLGGALLPVESASIR